MPSLLTTPRPLPDRKMPAVAASGLVLLALPVFLAAGWPLRGWLLAAALWAAGQAFGLMLTRFPLGAESAGASAEVGLGMSFRSVAVGVVLVVVAVSNAGVAVAAAIVYALAFTLELLLSLASYFSAEPLR